MPSLGQRIFDDDQGTRSLVLDVLKMFSRYAGIREVLDRVRAVARAPDRDVPTRRVAVRALGEMRDSRAVPLLVKLLGETKWPGEANAAPAATPAPAEKAPEAKTP